MLDFPGNLHVTNAALTLAVGGPGGTVTPVIHGCDLRLTNAGFVDLVAFALREQLAKAPIPVSYRGCKLIAGGAEIVVRARKGIIDAEVVARVALSASGNGTLRITIADVRAGMLPVSWLISTLLDRVGQQPGLTRVASQTVDLDIGQALRSRNIPAEWATRVVEVSVSPDLLTMICRP